MKKRRKHHKHERVMAGRNRSGKITRIPSINKEPSSFEYQVPSTVSVGLFSTCSRGLPVETTLQVCNERGKVRPGMGVQLRTGQNLLSPVTFAYSWFFKFRTNLKGEGSREHSRVEGSCEEEARL